MKDGSLDEYSAKLSTLEREQKRMVKELETLHNQGSKLREMERENKELQHAAVVERKTLAAIRYADDQTLAVGSISNGRESDRKNRRRQQIVIDIQIRNRYRRPFEPFGTTASTFKMITFIHLPRSEVSDEFQATGYRFHHIFPVGYFLSVELNFNIHSSPHLIIQFLYAYIHIYIYIYIYCTIFHWL